MTRIADSMDYRVASSSIIGILYNNNGMYSYNDTYS